LLNYEIYSPWNKLFSNGIKDRDDTFNSPAILVLNAAIVHFDIGNDVPEYYSFLNPDLFERNWFYI
jgi:hypothetical protein